MHQPLQNNTLFRGFMWAACLLVLLGCEPWKLPKKDFPKCEQPTGQIAHTANLLAVNFSLNPSSGTIDNVSWDFGDGKPQGSGFTTMHTFPATGTYTVKAILTNRCGQEPVIITKQVTVNNVVTPEVTTLTPSSGIGASIATGVRLVNNGNATITRFGICYSETNALPTIADGTVDGSGPLSITNPITVQLGAPLLQEGKEYYFRAFAINSAGPGYDPTVVRYTVPIATGLVAHYKFNNNGQDETTNDNDGSTTGGAGYGADRKSNSANGSLLLNGTNGYFEVPDKQSLWDVNQLTVSLWFKPASLPANDRRMQLFYKGRLDNSGGEQYSAKIGRLPSATLQITGDAKKDGNCVNGSGWKTAFDTSPTINIGQWHHVLVVFDGIEGKVYIDGREGSNKERLIGGIDKCQGGPLRIGAQITSDLNLFNGQIDDFRIYNRALNPAQINALKNE